MVRQRGTQFESTLKFELRTDTVTSDALTSSQTKEQPTLPLIRKIGVIAPKDTWNRPRKKLELINIWYKCESCKLHFSSLQEDANSFLCIVLAEMSVKSMH